MITTPKAVRRNGGPSNGWKERDMPIMKPAIAAEARDSPLATA